MICSRAWFALMRRNFVYLRRNWIGTILDVVLPIAFIGILVAIKNATESSSDGQLQPASYPAFAFTPLTFRDYVTAMEMNRVCVGEFIPQIGEELFQISGIGDNGYNWQVPFVKCDSRKCQTNGEDASDYCEFAMIALSPSSTSDTGGKERSVKFRNWLYETYPSLKTVVDFDFVQIFNDTNQMNDYVRSPDYGDGLHPKIGMGIVWTGNDANQYTYAIRQNSTNFNAPESEGRPATQTTPDTSRLFEAYTKNDTDSCIPLDGTAEQGPFQTSCTGQYMYNGVLTFQRLIGDFIISDSGAKDAGYTVAEAGVQYVPFPTFPFKTAGFFESAADYIPLLVTLGLIEPFANMVRYITREKELRQKELMKMMSVSESDIGWSWFVTFMISGFIIASASAGVSGQLYSNSEGFFLWLFWLFTYMAIVVFAMLMATFTSKSTRAVVISLLIFFIGSFLTQAVDVQTGDPSLISVVSLHPVAAFSYGLQVIGLLEDNGIGVTSSSAGQTDAPSGYTFNDSIQSLIFDSVFWGVITWYLNRVLRPDYGQALPMWFPFSVGYWCPGRIKKGQSEEDEHGDDYQGVALEPVSDALRRQSAEGQSIEICRLSKTFGEKAAVDNLSLSIYRGQITALLGHNGAGKTTTIAMLTGALAPTSGYATVAGKDIRTQMQGIRQDIGICLQHDCLFPLLTVREHVQFFSRLKGLYSQMSREEAEQHIDQAIQDVALSEKRNTLSGNLSGGMKRKLSVAIAFCGGSKVVLLDEPTSGMDPFSRRFTWNVIRQYRQDRCIILTTHFMDEADILGDRIAIMSEGQLRCAGSSLFLKKTYGVGYQLTIEKYQKRGNETTALIEADAHENDNNLKAIVRDAVPEATLLNNVGSEMSFQLPMGAAGKFGPMFDGLDNELEEKRISSYGVSITTLDEVFLLVARGETGHQPEFASSRMDVASSKKLDEDGDRSARSRMDLEKDGLFTRHLGALFRKRAAIFKRDKRAWMFSTILPSVFVLAGFLIFKFAAPTRNLSPVTLTLNDYNVDVTVGVRNPIAFNTAPSDFTCQPGVCTYQQTEFIDPGTNETVYFCGQQASLNSDQQCTISDSNELVGGLASAGATLEGTEVSNVLSGSRSLYATAKNFAATQYGAIFYTHDSGSVTSDGALYNETVIDLCNARTSSSADCLNFGGIGYVLQYNFTALHIGPLLQNLADEALIRAAIGSEDFVIQSTIEPLPITLVEESLGDAEDAFSAWFLVVLSFPFIAGSFASFVVAERETKAKHLQTVAGVKPLAYWMSTYLWDVLNYQIPLWIVVALMFIFDVNVLTTSDRGVFSGILVSLILYGPAMAGFTYCLTFAFTSPSLCNVFIIIFGFLIGMGGPLACFILILIGTDAGNPKPNLVRAADIVSWVLRFIPSFNLGRSLFYCINIEIFDYLEGGTVKAWSESILLVENIFLAWQSIIYVCLAALIDVMSTNPKAVSIWRRYVGFLTCRCVASRHQNDEDITTALPDDEDVIAEQERVLSGEANEDLIVVSNMTKVYDNGKIAVNNMSLGIPPGECFGLLGINGAGKTTTMGMLTAEFPPTSGDATLAGYSVTSQPEKTRRRIGYCPQFDAHFANMTGREHVELYASIKGVPRRFVKEAAAAKLREVGLSDADADRLSAGYSGGMKRRLSLACAMIGQPQIVFLDECSTGVDPVARREIWQLISDMVTGGSVPYSERTSVILTTHSMEECEALCPRIGIMANGRLRCLGSAQHLKNKFGQGYQVEMKVNIIDKGDDDYVAIVRKLLEAKGFPVPDPEEASAPAVEAFFDLDEAKAAVEKLTGDDFLSTMIDDSNPSGYGVWKDASSPVGVAVEALAAFAALELRIRKVAAFFEEHYPNHVLRERQDTKVRYEVASEGVKISGIFELIEETKDELRLSDYGVSQTSLEQVFNMHAAEAERLKQGRNDG